MTGETVECLGCGWVGGHAELVRVRLLGENDAIPMDSLVCPVCGNLGWEPQTEDLRIQDRRARMDDRLEAGEL